MAKRTKATKFCPNRCSDDPTGVFVGVGAEWTEEYGRAEVYRCNECGELFALDRQMLFCPVPKKWEAQ